MRTVHYNATNANGENIATVDSKLRYTRTGDGVSTPTTISNSGVTIAADGTINIAPAACKPPHQPTTARQ